MRNNHTELPWLKTCEDEAGVISKKDDQTYGMKVPILTCHSANAEADADLIVTACNYHHRLREALASLLSVEFAADCQECAIGQTEEWSEARALLAELDNLEQTK